MGLWASSSLVSVSDWALFSSTVSETVSTSTSSVFLRSLSVLAKTDSSESCWASSETEFVMGLWASSSLVAVSDWALFSSKGSGTVSSFRHRSVIPFNSSSGILDGGIFFL